MDPLQDEPGVDKRQIGESLQVQTCPPTLRSSAIVQSDSHNSTAGSGVCRWCKGAGYTRKDAPYGHPDFGKIEKCVCKLEAEREKRKQDLLGFSQLGSLAEKTFASFNGLVPGV